MRTSILRVISLLLSLVLVIVPCLVTLVACDEGTTTPGGDTTTPGGDTTTPGDDTTTPGGDTTTPGDDTTTPGDDTTTPGGDTTTPGGDTTTPGDDTTTPEQPTTYTVTFMADGVVVDTQTFSRENLSITVPNVPEKTGYTGAWESYTLGASDITVNAVYTPITYTATFVADGVTVATKTFTVENLTVDAPAVPEKTGYTGAWESYSLTASDITIHAVYATSAHTVTWVNHDGTTLETDTGVLYGTTPTYDSATPTKTGNAQYSYTFTGWTPEVSPVSGDITYTAVFSETTNTYTVTWLNYDGTTLKTDEEVPYGVLPVYNGDTPIKAGNAQFAYTFDGWDAEITAVTGDTTYTAVFSETTNTYTVTWENHDGTVLETDADVPYGTAPAYDGATPVKAADDYATYSFAGWSPAVTNVSGDVTYVAQFSAAGKSYTLTFVSNGGSAVESITQVYGTDITLPAPTRNEKSFAGWFNSTLSIRYTYTTMPAENVTLYAKWVDYAVTLSVNERTAISIHDGIDADTFSATAIDTDGNPVEVKATLLGGTYAVGNSIIVRLTATGLWGIYDTVTIRDIRVNGAPTITYNEEKDSINLSDTIKASLFGAAAVNTYGETLPVTISIKGDTYTAGDYVTVVLKAVDETGNETVVEISDIKVYGTPTITRDTAVVDMKKTDIISNAFFGVTATDTFGEALTVTTALESGTFAAGNTITVKSSTTDSRGNSHEITYTIKVYGAPTIGNETVTEFKVTDDITLAALGIVAKDSFGKDLTNVTLALTDGTQTAGATLTYLVTATDHLGNVATKTVSGIKIYGTPTISYNTEKSKINVTDTINAALFAATAEDSHGNALTVTVTLESGTVAGGQVVTFRFSATDHLGNAYAVVTEDIKVYSADDITLTYDALTSMKKTATVADFSAVATDSFGESCTVKIEIADGYTLAGGKTVGLYLVATDCMGNVKRSPLIADVKVYDIPTLTYQRDYDYIQAGDSPYALFIVKDSFDSEILFDVETVSGSLDIKETIVYRITARDRAGNMFSEEYELVVLDTDESILELYLNGDFIGTQRIKKGETLTLPGKVGYNTVWYCGSTALTDRDGLGLATWDKSANGYILTATRTARTDTPYVVNHYQQNITDDGYTLYATEKKTGTTDTSVTPARKSYTGFTAPVAKTVTIKGDGTLVVDYYYTRNTYKITLTTAHGTLDTTSMTIVYGATYSLPTLAKAGYTFHGWYSGSTEYFGGTWTRTSNLSLTAKWTANTNTPYVVNHYQQNITDDGYTLYATENKTGTTDTSVTPARKSYTGFTAPVAKTVTIKGDGTLVVDYYYTRNSYTLTIVGNGGTSSTLTMKYGATIVPNDLTAREGYELEDLYTDVALTAKLITMSAENTTAYARWVGENLPSDFTYYTSSGAVRINGYQGSGGAVVIPAYIGGTPVTSIGYRAFEGCTGLTSITIGNGVTSIGDSAFKGCTSLETLTIPFVGATKDGTSNTTGDVASNQRFSYIFGGEYNVPVSLKTVVITGGKSIGSSAFYCCTGLTSIVIPDSVTSIGIGAFYDCTGLTSVTIPDSVTSIGSRAFSGCTGLTSVTIPDSVTSIGYEAFSGCTGLTSVTIPNSVTSIGSRAFSDCTGLTSVTIPDSVKEIGGGAFYGCTGLTSITIPDSVTSIGDRAFSSCAGLTSITIPDSVTSIGDHAFSSCAGLTSVTIGNGVTSIDGDAFSYCYRLISVTIPNSVTSIGSSAFLWCTGLTSITIPDSVTSIGIGAFESCTGLTSVTIPDSVTSIGSYAFTRCIGLTSVTIGNGVESIGSFAFDGCYKLIEVYNRSSLSITAGSSSNGYIGGYAKHVYTDTTGTTKLKTIDDYVFYIDGETRYYIDGETRYLMGYVGNQTDLVLPDNCDGYSYEIYKDAFYNRDDLTSVTMGNGVTSIGDRAFSSCAGLTSITIPDSVTSIGDSAFMGCTGLTSVTMGDGVTSIDGEAFSGCYGLISVTIPNSVISIGFYAFNGCTNLTIYAEAASKPSGWNSDWNSSGRPVVWGYKKS